MDHGKLSFWNDEKGFGFISPDRGGRDVFVHIRDFKRYAGPPRVGQVLAYGVTPGRDGRLRAIGVTVPGEVPPLSLGVGVFFILGALVFWGGLSMAGYLHRIPLQVALWYGGAGVVAFLVYGLDKAAARNGGWRIRERTLHLLGLAGGWPGAILAQYFFHHKTRKQPFRQIFWMTVVLNCAGLIWFMTPGAWEKTVAFARGLSRETDPLLLKLDGMSQAVVSWGKQLMEML